MNKNVNSFDTPIISIYFNKIICTVKCLKSIQEIATHFVCPRSAMFIPTVSQLCYIYIYISNCTIYICLFQLFPLQTRNKNIIRVCENASLSQKPNSIYLYILGLSLSPT